MSIFAKICNMCDITRFVRPCVRDVQDPTFMKEAVKYNGSKLTTILARTLNVLLTDDLYKLLTKVCQEQVTYKREKYDPADLSHIDRFFLAPGLVRQVIRTLLKVNVVSEQSPMTANEIDGCFGGLASSNVLKHLCSCLCVDPLHPMKNYFSVGTPSLESQRDLLRITTGFRVDLGGQKPVFLAPSLIYNPRSYVNILPGMPPFIVATLDNLKFPAPRRKIDEQRTPSDLLLFALRALSCPPDFDEELPLVRGETVDDVNKMILAELPDSSESDA